MGRGLSDLQRYILHQAGAGRVYYADILAGFFGWTPQGPMRRHGEPGYPVRDGATAGQLMFPGSQHFSSAKVGARYRSNRAAVSRACRRLEQRGLVTCLVARFSRWAGVELTDKGREWLSVDTGANVPQ